MPTPVRVLLGCLAGILAAMLVIAGIQALGHLWMPPPEGLAEARGEQLEALLAGLPLDAWIPVLLSYFLGAEVGAMLAGWIGRRPVLAAAVVGAVLLGATAANLLLLPHPAWFAVASVAAVVAGSVGGGFNAWLFTRRRAANPGPRIR